MKLWCFTKLHFSGRNVISIWRRDFPPKGWWMSRYFTQCWWVQVVSVHHHDLRIEISSQTNGPRCTQAPHFGIFVPLQHLNKLKLCTTSPATRRTKSYDQSGTCRWTTCAVGISGYRWTMVNWWTDQVTVEQSTLSSKLRLKRTLWTRGWKLPRLWNLPLGFCRCGTESCPLTALFAPFESRNQGHKWP